MRYGLLRGWSRLPLITIISCVYAWLYIPLLALVVGSFRPLPTEQVSLTGSRWTVSWFVQLWHDEIAWAALRVSMQVASTATCISVLMGLAIIYWRVQVRDSFAQPDRILDWYRTLFYPNVVIPELILAVALLYFFVATHVSFGFMTLVVAHTLLAMGYAVPLIMQRYADIEYRLLEASLDLGATRTQTFVRVILPQLKNTLIAACLLVFIVSFDDFVLSYFCAGADVQTISLYLLALLRTGFSPVMTALATVLIVISTALVGIWCWYSFSREDAHE